MNTFSLPDRAAGKDDALTPLPLSAKRLRADSPLGSSAVVLLGRLLDRFEGCHLVPPALLRLLSYEKPFSIHILLMTILIRFENSIIKLDKFLTKKARCKVNW